MTCSSVWSRWLRRSLIKMALADAPTFRFPCFVKPMVPKQFRAAVYRDMASLLAETDGLDSSSEVIVAEPVIIEAEVRCFALEGATSVGWPLLMAQAQWETCCGLLPCNKQLSAPDPAAAPRP
jgi:ATP-grasp domain, R2K clade family 2